MSIAEIIKNPLGRPPAFKTPEDLLKACSDYFAWADTQFVNDRPIPYTQQSLCLFLGITRETWNQYKSKPIFSDIKARIDAAIYSQKFNGAACGLYQHQIIARDLGLGDKQSIEITDTADKSRDEMIAEILGLIKAETDE